MKLHLDDFDPKQCIHDATEMVDQGIVYELHHLVNNELRALEYVDQQYVDKVFKNSQLHSAIYISAGCRGDLNAR